MFYSQTTTTTFICQESTKQMAQHSLAAAATMPGVQRVILFRPGPLHHGTQTIHPGPQNALTPIVKTTHRPIRPPGRPRRPAMMAIITNTTTKSHQSTIYPNLSSRISEQVHSTMVVATSTNKDTRPCTNRAPAPRLHQAQNLSVIRKRQSETSRIS